MLFYLRENLTGDLYLTVLQDTVDSMMEKIVEKSDNFF